MPLYIIDNDSSNVRADAKLVFADSSDIRPGEVTVQSRMGIFSGYTLQTVCPRWAGGSLDEEKQLFDSYRVAVSLAARMECEKILLPFDTAVSKGFDATVASDMILGAVSSGLDEADGGVSAFLAVENRENFRIPEDFKASLSEYIEKNDITGAADSGDRRRKRGLGSLFSTERVLKRALKSVDEGRIDDFGSFLFKTMKARGLEPGEVCRGANLNPKVLKKLHKSPDFVPGREAVQALAISMRLTPAEGRALLEKAGYDPSYITEGDVIVNYCLENEIFDISRVNSALFVFGQKQLG